MTFRKVFQKGKHNIRSECVLYWVNRGRYHVVNSYVLVHMNWTKVTYVGEQGCGHLLHCSECKPGDGMETISPPQHCAVRDLIILHILWYIAPYHEEMYHNMCILTLWKQSNFRGFGSSQGNKLSNTSFEDSIRHHVLWSCVITPRDSL